MLVVLRITIGCHFLYEGVWKFKHAEFSAEPFLTQAKGPAAPLFYAMVHDINGRQRLKIETNPKSGKSSISGKVYLGRMGSLGPPGNPEVPPQRPTETRPGETPPDLRRCP